jgi:hypothetical protein
MTDYKEAESDRDIGSKQGILGNVNNAITQAQQLPAANACDSQAILAALLDAGLSFVQLLQNLVAQKAPFDY